MPIKPGDDVKAARGERLERCVEEGMIDRRFRRHVERRKEERRTEERRTEERRRQQLPFDGPDRRRGRDRRQYIRQVMSGEVPLPDGDLRV